MSYGTLDIWEVDMLSLFSSMGGYQHFTVSRSRAANVLVCIIMLIGQWTTLYEINCNIWLKVHDLKQLLESVDKQLSYQHNFSK